MSFLKLNGTTITTSTRSGGRKHELWGERSRAFDSTMRDHRTDDKRTFAYETSPALSVQEADSLVALVLGLGHQNNFTDTATTLYTSKGLATSATSGTITRNVAGGYNSGKKVQLGAAAYARWTPSGRLELIDVNNFTLACRRWTGAAWEHLLTKKYGTAAQTYWLNGVATGSFTKIAINAGYFQIGDGTNADDFSDLVFFPYCIPDSWVPQWNSNTREFSPLPFLELSGETLPSGFATAPYLAVCGDVEDEDAAGRPISGAWKKEARVVSFSLAEQ